MPSACAPSDRGGRVPVVLEVLAGLGPRVEERRRAGDRAPRPGEGLVPAPLVLEVLPRLAVEHAHDAGHVGPGPRVAVVRPAALAVLEVAGSEARGQLLRGRQLPQVEVVLPGLLEVLEALGRGVEEGPDHGHVVEREPELGPALEALPRELGVGPEPGDRLEARHGDERPVLGLARQEPRVLEAGVEHRHQSGPPVSPFVSVTVPSTGNSWTRRRTSAGSPLRLRSPGASPILRTPSVSRMTLNTSDQAISPTGLPSASSRLKPKSTRRFGVPSGSVTRKYATRLSTMRARTVVPDTPARRNTRAATSRRR